MALPDDFTSLEDYLDDLLWTGAYLSATKKFRELGQTVLAVRAQVVAASGNREKTREAVVLTSVAQFIAWENLREPLASFERQVDALFDHDRQGYGKVFPLTVPAMHRLPEKQRVAGLKPVVDFAGKRHTGKLAKTGKAFLAAWQDYAEAAKAGAEADAALKGTVAAVAEKKHAGVLTMRKVEGKLREEHPDDPAQARKPFRAKKHGKPTLEQVKKNEARLEKELTQARALRAKLEEEAAAAAEKKAKQKQKQKKDSGKKGSDAPGTTTASTEPTRLRG